MDRASIELHRIAADVAAIPDAGLYAAAKLVKKLADEQAQRATGDGTMAAGVRRPIKLKARDKGIRPLNDGRAILVVGAPAGPWSWLTSGTAAHDIRRRKRGPMRKMTVRHPGSRGKGTWLAVIARSEQLVPAVFVDLVDRAVN